MAHTPWENAALVRRFLTDVVAGGDTDATGAVLAEDVRDHNLVFGDGHGRETMTALGWRVLATADVTVDIKDVAASDERVAVRGTAAGTHRESLMDLAPTGRPFEIPYAWFFRVDDGRIAEIWSLPDGLGLMQELGALPELPAHRQLADPTDRQ